MEKLRALLSDAEHALARLREILAEDYSVIVRDATIQRFEFTFEVAWKLTREYLKRQEGVICNSPKECFRKAFKVGLLDDEQSVVALQMVDDRNNTVHTYREPVAAAIFAAIPGHFRVLEHLVTAVRGLASLDLRGSFSES